MLESSSPNALLKRDYKKSVQIVHPTHPLRGQRLSVLPMVGGKADTSQILIALPGGGQQLIPIEWTDQVDHPRYPAGSYFPFERLVLLRQRLNHFLEKGVKQAILIVNELELDPCGGSDANQRSTNPLGTNEPRTARSNHCHPGADGAAPMDPGNRGAA